MTRNPENTHYGRCEATSKTTGEQCGRAAIGDHGKCGYHGGKGGAPSGPDNGNWKDGLASNVVRPEDQELLDAIEKLTTAEILRETLEYQTMKLFRALESMESTERQDVLDAIAGLINRVEDPSTDDLAAVAQMLGENNRAMREQIKLIIRNAEKLHKITDGEQVTVEHDTTAELDELKDMADDLF